MAFFCFCGVLFYPPSQQSRAANHCDAGTVNEYVKLINVIDGDTVVTEGDRTIRLVGIDTPEIDYDTGQSEHMALEAKQFLIDLLRNINHIGMVYDEETRDQYGRTLAHLFLPDGRNIQEEILKTGLAVPFSAPPNLRFSACYYEAVAMAQDESLGLWALAEFQPIAAAGFREVRAAYRRITGQVERLYDSKQSLTLVLDNRVYVTVGRETLKFLNKTDINRLLHNQIQVHGFVYMRGRNYGVDIHHPSQIRLK